jgi:hypothetical protein
MLALSSSAQPPALNPARADPAPRDAAWRGLGVRPAPLDRLRA